MKHRPATRRKTCTDAAESIELDRQTVSQVMNALDEFGFVNRAPDYTGRAYRVILTTKGERVLQQANGRVEALLPTLSRED